MTSSEAADPGTPDPDGAFVERYRLAGRPDGPLSGTRFAVKDNIAVADMAFTAGHPMHAGRKAHTTATAVRRLLDAGADFVGMTTTDAGGFGATTPATANPVLPGHIVGGSSGGSAAAVARGHCDFALGTDTGGSVRIPAACTGLAAFKPSYGRVPVDGVVPLAPSMDHVGLIARDLDTLSRAGHMLIDGTPAPAPARLRLAVESDPAGLWHPAVADEIEDAVARLARAGHEVDRVEVPDRPRLIAAHGVLVLSEAAEIYAGLDDAGLDRLGPAARRALRHAADITPDMIDDANAARTDARAFMDALFDGGCHALISPTLPVPPPRVDDRRVEIGGVEVPVVVAMTYLTSLTDMTGHPVVALPVARDPEGMPGSLQIAAPPGDDEALFATAAAIADALAEACP